MKAEGHPEGRPGLGQGTKVKMNDEEYRDDSSEGEMEFEGRGRQLGECQVADIIANEEIADHEEVQTPGPMQQALRHPYNLPPVPELQPYQHPQERHDRILHMPREFSGEYDPIHNSNRRPPMLRPVDFFTLFFNQETFEYLAQNTNQYATARGAGGEGSRKWYPVKAAEVMIFVGLVIYMEIYRSSSILDYWRRDGLAPLHRYISPSTSALRVIGNRKT